jgi:hypothetical protein
LWWTDATRVRGTGSEESVDHILLHCDVAYVIWITFFSRFGLSGVRSRHVVDMFTCWTTSNTRSVATWKMVSTCLLWCLWREMNDKTFKDRERTLEENEFFFFKTLYLWIVVYVSPLTISYSDFLVLFDHSS